MRRLKSGETEAEVANPLPELPQSRGTISIEKESNGREYRGKGRRSTPREDREKGCEAGFRGRKGYGMDWKGTDDERKGRKWTGKQG